MKKVSNFPELPPEKLRWTLDRNEIPVVSSEECKPCEGIIGQERALKAIQVGLDIKSFGYNIFIAGMVGTGRTTTIKQLLEKLEKEEDTTPDDVLYVNNFRNPDEPVLITLPAGKGKEFKEAMRKLVETLRTRIPEMIKSKFYSEKREVILKNHQKKQQAVLQKFEDRVSKEGFSAIQVQVGTFVKPDLAPTLEGKPASFQQLEALVKEKKFAKKDLDRLKKKYEELTQELERVLEKMKENEDETRNAIAALDEEMITPIVKSEIDRIRSGFPSQKTADYLDAAERNLIKNIDVFKNQKKEESEKEAADPLLEYGVNLLIDNSDLKGAPVVMETNPTYMNLFGSIEQSYSPFGAAQTDFSKIKAGSFLKANGGYLVINALDAIVEPGVWLTLKRTLRNQTLEIQNYSSLFLFATSRLKPEPIKCDVKVVLIGEAQIYNLLYYSDRDFKKIFKVKAEFDSEMTKDEDTIKEYVTFIKKISDEDGLKPFDKGAIAAVIEYGTRLAGRQTKISTRFHVIADVLRESSYWAGKGNKDQVEREQVEKAVEERYNRVSLVESKIQELIEEGTLMIDTQGEVVGQVNGLSVYDMGEFAFGKPTRITATTAVGRAGVINIEREAELSGRTHNKGVLILAGYLRAKYARNKPFSLSASLAFEQSYSGVDGDSASSTEVYAILSSLSNVPLRQDIAVTGSLNQRGEIQPIGGINEKIEGFYDVCKARDLTGTQGVIIPRRNVENLMLRGDVIESVQKGEFHIYPVKTIDEGIEVLTGVKAGERLQNGAFEEGTINYMVDRELERLAQSWKSFAAEGK
jgi:lon-related putative ATP-dependent protease